MKKICSMLITMVILLSSITCTTYANEENLRLYAQSAVLMDGDTGRILFSQNGTDTKANASTTKILTCILALEYGEMSDVTTASEYAKSQPKVHLGVTQGETFYLSDMLYALMLESFNDCAVIIAEHISGSVEAFAKLMNDKAKEIGCIDTYFITPNGLDASEDYEYHHTTGEDLALLMRYCIKESPMVAEFLEITQTASHSFTNVEGTKHYSCTNRNTLLTTMSEAISGKTGFTNDAGYCYVGAIESEGRTFIVTLLACGWPNNRNYKWSDCQTLFEYAKNNYHYQQIPLESLNLSTHLQGEVLNSNEDEPIRVPLTVSERDEVSVLMKESEKIQVSYQYSKVLYAPIKEETIVGTASYYLDEILIAIDPIITTVEVEKEEKFLWW